MRLHSRTRRGGRTRARARGALRGVAGCPAVHADDAQRRVLAQIRADLARPHPMQRLLQGDVGSGKTIVAALAALQAIENGYQAAVMAPTEILAEQHFASSARGCGRSASTSAGSPAAWRARSKRRRSRQWPVGRGAGRHRHPCAVPGGGRVQQARPGDRRRAASLRRAPAAGVAHEGQPRRRTAAPADDERDADPAHAGDELLRRPRRVGNRRTAARPHAGADQAGVRCPSQRGDPARARCLPRGRQAYWVCPLD